MEQNYSYLQHFCYHPTFWFTEPWILWSDPLVYPLETSSGCWCWNTPLDISSKSSQFSFHFCHLQEVFSLQLLSYPITANHFTSLSFASDFRFNLSFSQPPAPFLGFFVNDLFNLFHWLFCLHLPWCFTSSLRLAEMSILLISCFH